MAGKPAVGPDAGRESPGILGVARIRVAVDTPVVAGPGMPFAAHIAVDKEPAAVDVADKQVVVVAGPLLAVPDQQPVADTNCGHNWNSALFFLCQ